MPQSEKFVRLVLIATALIVNVLLFGLLSYTLIEARHHEERQTRTTIENLALLLDQSVTESVGKIDLSLREIADEMERELRLHGRIDTREVNDLLTTRRNWIAGLADIRVTDAFGTVVYGPGTVRESSFTYADREFFIEHRSRSDTGLVVTNPIMGRVSNTWVISFSRRYSHPDRSFAGVISAAVPVSHFDQLLADLDLGPNGIAVLRDAGSAQIARHPAVANPNQQLGTKVFSRELADIIASGVAATTYHSDRTGDGVERTNTYRRLSAVPFHLVVGMATDDYLADWQNSIWKASVFAAIFLFASTMTAYLLWRSFSLTKKASTRSKLLLQHASDGIHIIDSDGNVIEASDSFCRMLGYARADVIGMNLSQFYVMYPVDMIAQHSDETAAGRPIVTMETRHRRKNGEILDVEITTYRMDLDGRQVLYASSRDITERKRVEEERRIAAIAFESREGMFVTDANHTIIRVNHTFTALTGFEAGEVIGRTHDLLSSGRHDADFNAAMWRAIQEEGFWQGEVWNRRKDGKIFPEWLTITAVRDSKGQTTHYVGSFSDITQRVEDETEIRNLAFYDPLTGLANRQLLTDRLGHAFAKSSRNLSRGAVIFVDLDNFKDLNDTLGHAQGDRLLELVAGRLTENVREDDTVARFGGDEFVVLLEDLGMDRKIAADKAVTLAEKLRAALNEPYLLQATHAQGWQCTPSIGVALFLGHDGDIDAVLARADQALYAAKEGGRNRVRLNVM